MIDNQIGTFESPRRATAATPPVRPLLTLITISYNVLAGFRATSASLPEQLPEWCEWVVVDGNSSDGTKKEIERQSHRIVRFISEPDKGISDAFNKALGLAKGRYVLFLNSGDCLMEGFFETVLPLIQPSNAPPVIVGRINIDGRLHGRAVSFSRQWLRNYLPHQAMLIRRGLFRLLGPFDESYSLGMDFEWSLRLKHFWTKIQFIEAPLADMDPGGRSLNNYKDTYSQYHRSRLKHCDQRMLSLLAMTFFRLKHAVGYGLRRTLK